MAKKVSEIAEFLGGDIEGDGSILIEGLADIEQAQEGQLAFVSSQRCSKWMDSTKASALVVFKEAHGIDADGGKIKHYYANESVGIACGFLIAALHNMGLTTLTYTPNPMGFLSQILQRPPNERPYLVLPVGYPAEDATVPDIGRKDFEEVAEWR